MTKTKTFKSKMIAAGLAAFALLGVWAATPVLAVEVDDDASDATVEFTGGLLQLTSVPDLDFGTHIIEGGTQTYNATPIANPVEVSDLRGSGEGWNLTAALSGFTTGGTPTLAGSYITVTGAPVSSPNTNNNTPPVAPSPIRLDSDDTAAEVLVAADNAGQGVWQSIWENATSTTLTVLDGTAEVGIATATINWSLEDVPDPA